MAGTEADAQPGVTEPPAGPPRPSAPAVDVAARLRSAAYARLLLLAALVGVPISAAAYFFLQIVDALQEWVFTGLPHELGFAAAPLWAPTASWTC